MKKFIAPMLIGATLATAAMAADDSLRAEIEALKAQMAELKEAQSKVNYDALKRQLSEVKAHDAGDNIKWTVDFRSAYDYVDYKVNGSEDTSNSIWTNKLVLGMAAQPLDNLVFKGSLGFYKAYGQNNLSSNGSLFQDFDWYNNEKPQSDNTIRLREAYFLYFGQMGDIPYTASFGRRPSVSGFMTNLREDNDHAASPVGHNINMEFDGASFMFDFEKLTDISGLYFKICIGRGFSDLKGSYSMGLTGFNPAYIKDDENPNMDLVGLLARLYDDGQYKVMANYFIAKNLMGMDLYPNQIGVDANTGAPIYSTTPGVAFTDVGDMDGWSLSVQVNGIGDEISDFLDDTIFFASYAGMKTKPNGNSGGMPNPDGSGTIIQAPGMLGSVDSETGYSYYLGLNVPCLLVEDARWGFEYNHGSKYWRSFTYGEDTMIGSKLATRGDAYEVYYNLPLLGKNLTAQLRYTYIDYDYTGSDTFFGWTGTPMDVDTTPGAVKSASNIRASLRYRY